MFFPRPLRCLDGGLRQGGDFDIANPGPDGRPGRGRGCRHPRRQPSHSRARTPTPSSTWSAIPVCAGLHKPPVDTDEIALKDGKLANVFVYVKSGLEGQELPGTGGEEARSTSRAASTARASWASRSGQT